MNEFFQNVSRYPRFLIALILGIFLTAVRPLLPLLQNPPTAIAIVAAGISGFLFLVLTLRAMLAIA